MDRIVAGLCAIAILAAGVVLIPAVKGVTDIIFNTELVSSMPAVLQMLVGAWPFFLIMAFVFGAYMLIKTGNR